MFGSQKTPLVNCHLFEGPVAQWIRHLTTNQGIAGSNPARDVFFFGLFLKTGKKSYYLFLFFFMAIYFHFAGEKKNI